MSIDKDRLKRAMKISFIGISPWLALQGILIGVSWWFKIHCAPLTFIIQVILFSAAFRYGVEKVYGEDLDFSSFDVIAFTIFGQILGAIYHSLGLLIYHSPVTMATYGIFYYFVNECVKKLKK